MKKNPFLFSKRKAMALKAVDWCKDKGAVISPLNIVTALHALGYLPNPKNLKKEKGEKENGKL